MVNEKKKKKKVCLCFFLSFPVPLVPLKKNSHRISALIPALRALSLAAAASSHRVCNAATFASTSECASENASRPSSPEPPPVPFLPPSVALTYFSYLFFLFSFFCILREMNERVVRAKVEDKGPREEKENKKKGRHFSLTVALRFLLVLLVLLSLSFLTFCR